MVELKEYLKDGNRCILCVARKKLIRITPEEVVRQRTINKLISENGVPRQMIDAEVPLSYYKKGASGRADIIVSGIAKDGDNHIPLVLVECKEPNVLLTDRVEYQILRYDSVVRAKILLLTNGRDEIVFHYLSEEDRYQQLNGLPQYEDLLDTDYYEPKELEVVDWQRPSHNILDDRLIKELKEYGHIGEDSDSQYHSLLVNLLGLIFDPNSNIESLNLPSRRLIEDGGMRFTTFGNASGGGFPRDYRYLIFERNDGETQILSFTIMGKLSAVNHPLYRNSNGHSLFLFAIDDYENSHLSFEYAIDRFVVKENQTFTFWHDGTLTLGKRGRVKNQEVIDYMKGRRPELIRDGKVYLGQVDNSIQFEWHQEDVQNLITNFIAYSFLRDEFRNSKKYLS
ncbi:type I restriction enzyme HsdR N-terminal domain-containing protein [Autumnicola musiva]|uniref:Type I restriction enzyme HsdR N-terminal domain-containing protein n=1 Tax=Autumnicola musiva TaxID=3075589 RepID=A0ABU3D0P7_9FLAO|nr:type I restriction enzyme HsdR N-terminal domain-containing protein [Zunongwangia sp. F117]MDT0675118.1 type I restriction enzyme HsdR N-terminal domain-containing protein [Zunongwangia sp. F117]